MVASTTCHAKSLSSSTRCCDHAIPRPAGPEIASNDTEPPGGPIVWKFGNVECGMFCSFRKLRFMRYLKRVLLQASLHIPMLETYISKSGSVCALQSQGFGLCLSRRHHVPFRRGCSGGCPNGASSSCVAKLASLGTCVVRRTWSLLLLRDNREPVGPEDAVPPRGQCNVVRSVLQACHSLGPSSPRRRRDQAVGFSAAVVYIQEREALPFTLRAEMSSTASGCRLR